MNYFLAASQASTDQPIPLWVQIWIVVIGTLIVVFMMAGVWFVLQLAVRLLFAPDQVTDPEDDKYT